MGARSNIVVIDPGYSKNAETKRFERDAEKDGRVWLYGHWMGPSAIHHARHGLKSGRVMDPSYLARIIFNSMTKGYEDDETGYGISTRITDNEYPVIVIDPAPAQSVVDAINAALGEERTQHTALVWLEDEKGTELTPKVTATQFVAMAEDIDDYDELARRMGAPEPTVPDDDV
jgi:hypothetical protein